MAPAVVIRPILLPANSAYHSAPSGPVVIPLGSLLGVVTGYPVMWLYAPDCGSALRGSPRSNAARQKAFTPRGLKLLRRVRAIQPIRLNSSCFALVYTKRALDMGGIYAAESNQKAPTIVQCLGPAAL
jgi:hypothetical protein